MAAVEILRANSEQRISGTATGERARSLRSDLPKLRFEDVLAGGSRFPLHPPFAERLPGVIIPIPRSARILNRELAGYRSRVHGGK